MKKYKKPENPVFFEEITITETGDPGHADNINAAPKQIFENTLVNKKEIESGDSKDRTVTFISNDSEDADEWTDMDVIKPGEKHKSLFSKVSTMFKNVRFLYKILGTTDISKLGDGTVTGVMQDFNAALDKKVNFTDITRSAAVNVAGKMALDAVEKNALVEGTMAHDISQIYSNIASKLSNNGYYAPDTNINDMTNPGIYRFYINSNTDNANYLGWTGRTLLICSGNCAGFMHQIFFYVDGGYCAIRRNVTQGNIVFDFDVPLHRVDSKAEITQFENRIKALEQIINH